MCDEVVMHPPYSRTVSVASGRSLWDAADLGLPGEHLARIEIRLEHHRLDRLDPPAVGEALLDLFPRDPAGAPIARLPIAEAQHVEAPARRRRSPQALDVPGPIVVIEHVEQPAVQHRVELLSQALEV